MKIENVDLSKRKNKQLLLWPLAALIMGVSALRGESGRRKYWLDATNSPAVLMGGNTLIITAIVEADGPTSPPNSRSNH
jgi:hypothetical protein